MKKRAKEATRVKPFSLGQLAVGARFRLAAMPERSGIVDAQLPSSTIVTYDAYNDEITGEPVAIGLRSRLPVSVETQVVLYVAPPTA
jgi:hypothetical protein